MADRIHAACAATLHPLHISWSNVDQLTGTALAFNEAALFRETARMIDMSIKVNGIVRLATLIGDGVLISTPAGSAAYNMSVQGPILPLDAGLLAMTPISPFRPRRWRGALLPDAADISVEVSSAAREPASMTADYVEVRGVQSISVRIAPEHAINLLLNANRSFGERVIREQFKT